MLPPKPIFLVATMDLPSPSAAFPTMPGAYPSPIAPPPPSGESGTAFSGSMNWEPVRQRLLGTDMKDALLAATELREGIEIVHTTEFPLMLSALLPAFSSILAHRTSPSPDTSTVEHKLRNVVLEIISRLPSNEVLRPHAPHLVAVALDILNRDFEDNALLASRIIFDLYKVYRSLPQDYVQPYLDFVQTAYRALPSAVQRNFLFPALAADPSPGSERKRSISLELKSLDGKGVTPSQLLATPTGKAPATTAYTTATTYTATDTTTTATDTTNITATNITTPGDKDPKTPVATSFTPSGLGTPMAGIPTSPVPRLSLRSNSSFRVLTECPLIVMLMFQLYPKFLKTNIPVLINVMMEALALRAPPIQSITQGNQTTLDSNGQRLYFSRCRELVAAQAKTLSFLTYLLRGFSNELKPYEDRLASNVVALMSTCPREFISTRKELLVATRHLLNSDFRNGFFRHVDALLDERVLMGSHHRYSDQTILRPLGYTTLSDLVHHVRSLLTMSQMSRVVGMFSRVLHDSSMTLPMSTQYTAVRTLLSVVDIVFHNKDPNPQIGRDILVRILKTLVDKLSTLKDYYPLVDKGTGEENKGESSGDKGSYVDAMETDETEGSFALSHEQVMHKLELSAGTDPAEAIKDLKSMVRAIIVGHKTVIWYINNYRAQREKEKIENSPPPVGSNEEVASAMLKMTHSERDLIDNYIVLALPCIKLLNEGADSTKSLDTISASDQYRDALTYFAAAFTTLDGHDLRCTLGRRLELVVEAIVDEPTVMVIPRHLLGSNAATSFEFCSLLLDFLVVRMEELATSRPPNTRFISAASGRDYNEVERLKKLTQEISQRPEETEEERTKRSTTYLQLFERVLKSLSVYPDNEKALRPHLKTIVSTCLRSSMEKSDFQSDNYCMLLRYVFRSISAGKFEDSYRELLPLIPAVLNGMYRIVRATDDSVHHYTAIELFLTIPARLSSLLPHMNLLLRIIIRALQSSSGDLVNLG
jgi:transformation/transcription domain-associated protein